MLNDVQCGLFVLHQLYRDEIRYALFERTKAVRGINVSFRGQDAEFLRLDLARPQLLAVGAQPIEATI